MDKKSSLIPIVVGVVGHRYILEEDISLLETKINDIFQYLKHLCKNTPITLLCTLSGDTDMLAAKIALELDVDITVVLPLNEEEHLWHLVRPGLQQELYSQLLSKAKTIELPMMENSIDESLRTDDSTYGAYCEQIGAFIAQNSQLLIALWDGKSDYGKGNVYQIINFKLHGVPAKYRTSKVIQDILNRWPVFHVVTPSIRNEVYNKAEFSIWLINPGTYNAIQESCKWPDKPLDERYSGILKKIDEYNTDFLTITPKYSASNLKEEISHNNPEVLNTILDKFAAADILAIHYYERRNNSFALISLYNVLVVLLLIICRNVSSFIPLYIFPLAVSIMNLIYFFKYYKMNYTRGICCRVLAEGLMVQFYWNIMGMGEKLQEYYLINNIKQFDWIRIALNSSYLSCYSSFESSLDTKINNVNIINNVFIEDMLKFIDHMVVKLKREINPIRIIKKILIYLLAICGPLLLFFNTELSYSIRISSKDILFLVGCILPHMVMSSITMYNKLSSHRKSILEGNKVGRRFEVVREYLNQSIHNKDIDMAKSVLREASLEYLTNSINSMMPVRDSRVIRLFISSTFKDMQNERNYLVKKTFPALRQSCRERGVEFIDIDLRWGITEEESETGKIIQTCIEEINRCTPYFIGILGERYGWIPLPKDIADNRWIRSKFPGIFDMVEQGTSITEIEIIHGVLDNPDMYKNVFFYFMRREEGKCEEIFFEDDELKKSKLIYLKKRILESGFPVREDIPDGNILGRLITEDLKEVIDEKYPLNTTSLSPVERIRIPHEAFAASRSAFYIKDPTIFNFLDKYIKEYDQPLVVYGKSGGGKSSLLANWAVHYKKKHTETHIIEYYVSAGSNEKSHIDIMKRIIQETGKFHNVKEIGPDEDLTVVQNFENYLSQLQIHTMIILIDGLDQLNTDNLMWLPKIIDTKLRVIVSVNENKLELLLDKNWKMYELPPLNNKQRQKILNGFFQRYTKKLSIQQQRLILDNDNSYNPLFLTTVLEELRTFGSFEDLTDRIKHYLKASNLDELFELVIMRVEEDFGREFVRIVTTQVLDSEEGVSEVDLREITGFNQLDISQFISAFEYHFIKRNGRYGFSHDYLTKAVRKRYVSGFN